MTNTYFLGGTSAVGFQTKFNEWIARPDYFTYILKGGPGTGKSTLMKKVAAHFSEGETDLYYCSSDIGSLDAVVIKEKKAIIVDGTAPHVFNADYPGVSQTLVDLGACWNRKKLKERETEIRRCISENAGYHRRARSFVTALSHVNDSVFAQASDALCGDEITEVAEDLATYLPNEAGTGSCTYNQLAAITSEGYSTREKPDARDVFGISDPQYAAGSGILDQLKMLLLQKGQDIIVSECYLFGTNRIKHIIVPKHNLQISLVKGLNHLNYDTRIDCNDLYVSLTREEISRALKLATSLEQEAAYSIKRALEVHDELESNYIAALDFKKLDRLTQQLIEEIEAL